jgi:hypothetical protein
VKIPERKVSSNDSTPLHIINDDGSLSFSDIPPPSMPMFELESSISPLESKETNEEEIIQIHDMITNDSDVWSPSLHHETIVSKKSVNKKKTNSDEVTSDQPIAKRLRKSHPDDTQIESPPSVPITSEQKSSLSVSINSEDSLPDMPTMISMRVLWVL